MGLSRKALPLTRKVHELGRMRCRTYLDWSIKYEDLCSFRELTCKFNETYGNVLESLGIYLQNVQRLL